MSTLDTLDLEQEQLCHWEVTFEAKIDKSQLDIEDVEAPEMLQGSEPFIWVSDSLITRAGEDGILAINKVKNHVLNQPEDYGIAVTEFRLVELKLLSAADL